MITADRNNLEIFLKFLMKRIVTPELGIIHLFRLASFYNSFLNVVIESQNYYFYEHILLGRYNYTTISLFMAIEFPQLFSYSE